MRFVRAAGIFLLLAILAFVSIGFLYPEVRYETTISVSRSPSTAFSVLSDGSLMPEWLDGFISIEPLLETDAFVGNRYTMLFEQDGDTLEFREEITHFVENELFGIRLVHDMFSNESQVVLTKTTNGTTITASNEVRGSNFFYRSLFPFMTASMASAQAEQYHNLAALIEQAPTSLIGEWTGTDESGAEHLFNFHVNGTASWAVSSEAQTFALEGFNYQSDAKSTPRSLDLSGFTDGPLRGRTLFGIVEFEGEDGMRFDAEAGSEDGSSVRPTSFSKSTVTYTRIR